MRFAVLRIDFDLISHICTTAPHRANVTTFWRKIMINNLYEMGNHRIIIQLRLRLFFSLSCLALVSLPTGFPYIQFARINNFIIFVHCSRNG